MTIRTDWLAAIKEAKNSGLDGLAFALIAMHDLAFPSESLKPYYDRMALEALKRDRQLVEVPPTWSYPKLDGTIRERPIPYYRRTDGAIVRYLPRS